MAERTLLFYYPYAANLQNYFRTNVQEMSAVITTRGGTADQHVMVLLSTSATSADLYELVYTKGHTNAELRQQYTDIHYSSSEDLRRMLRDIKTLAPAKTYSMVIGAHGMGWVPAEDAQLAPMRSFGGISIDTQIDIEDFAQVLRDVQMPLEFLLFDCCYMATVETCYALRDVVQYIIASTSELMGPGMPYLRMGQYLLGEPNYSAITREFYDFYMSYRTPCGTLSVIDMARMEELADFTREMVKTHYIDAGYVRLSQVLDGYDPPVFYDFGDYITHFHLLDDEPARLQEVLSRVVTYCVHTPTYYSTYTARQHTISHFSGLTTSAPSMSLKAVRWSDTEWAHAIGM